VWHNIFLSKLKPNRRVTSGACKESCLAQHARRFRGWALFISIHSTKNFWSNTETVRPLDDVAVEEQSVTWSEVSRNLSEAARGSAEVARNISGVAQAAQNTSAGSAENQKAAMKLAQLSTQLSELAAKFKVSSNGSSAKRPRNDGQIKKGNFSHAARDQYEVGVGS
jgi:hypothetical protein